MDPRNRRITAALVQTNALSPRAAMVAHQVEMIERGARAGAEIVCLQELSTSPYFCQIEAREWFDLAEPAPDGPTTRQMQAVAREFGTVLVVPLFEEDAGAFYSTAVVIDADGSVCGKYRKSHIPNTELFYETFYFRAGNLGFPVFDTAAGRVGVYICYDRHFPDGARALGEQGAEIVFIPSATAGRTYDLWHVEQRELALANGYFVGTINRVGVEPNGPLEFYGHSYFADPLGRIVAEAGTGPEVLVAELDLALAAQARLDAGDRAGGR